MADKSLNKWKIRAGYFSTIIVLIFVVILCVFESDSHTTIKDSYKLYTIPGWQLDGKNVDFPCSFDAVAGKEVVLSNVLPDKIPEGFSLTFRTLYSACRVYVDDVEIADYAVDNNMLFGKMSGNIRLIVPLNESYESKPIKISLIPYYDTNNADLAGVEFGYSGDIKTSIIYYNLLRFFVAGIMMTIAAVAFIFVAYAISQKSVLNAKVVGNFAIFTVTIATWIVCSSDIPQILGRCNGSASVISYLCLSMMASSFAGFCEQLLPKGQRLFEKIRYVGWTLPIINIIGMVFNLFDPPKVLILSHLSIVAISVAAIVYSAKDCKKSKAGMVLLISIIELVVVTVAGFTCFFLAPSRGYDGMIFGLGMLVFILMMFVVIFVKQIRGIEESRSVEIYRELAFTDILTGLNNRGAFDREFSRLSEKSENGVWVTLFMFDINFLKAVNDTYGHQAGDHLIVSLAECLRAAFGRYGNCYRLGGDEFAVVCINQRGHSERMLEAFDAEIERRNANNDREISVARGYAELAYNGEKNFMSTIFKLADQEMYMDKQIKHNQKWSEE